MVSKTKTLSSCIVKTTNTPMFKVSCFIIFTVVGFSAGFYDILPFPAGLEVLGPKTESETSALVYSGYGIGYIVGAAVPSKFIKLEFIYFLFIFISCNVHDFR